MSTFRGRDRDQHEEWIRENPDYYSVFLWRGKQRADAATLDDALALATKALEGEERNTQPAMIYAIKEVFSTLVGTYHPIIGFKPTRSAAKKK